METRSTPQENKEHFAFLDTLRESGITNMFGAAVTKAHPLVAIICIVADVADCFFIDLTANVFSYLHPGDH